MLKLSIALGVVSAVLLGLLLRANAQSKEEIHRMNQDWQQRVDALEQRLRQQDAALSSSKSNLSATELIAQMEESCDRIMNLGLAPMEQKKEEQKADQLGQRMEKLKTESIAAIEERFPKPGNLEFKRRLMRLLGKIDAQKGYVLAEQTFLREGENVTIRWAAAAVMKEIDSVKAEPVLSKFLLNNDGSRHQGMLYLVDYVKDIGTYDAQQTILKAALDGKKDSSVRYRAIACLGDLKVVEALPHLYQMIESSPDAYTRRVAARAAVLIKPEEACIFLKEIEGRETDPGLKTFLQTLITDVCK